ncbi:MAG: hypothetical protein ACYTBJ_15935 [Planctomycetota bacterium]|jgi:hypothetical protein
MAIFILHILAAVLIVLYWLFFWRMKGRRLWSFFFLGLMLQFILSLPAGFWQAVFLWPDVASGSPLWHRLIFTPVMGWPFNAGGFTVRWLFEATVGPLQWLVGPRTAIVLGNIRYYWLLLALQAALLAYAFARRYARKRNLRDWFLVALAILFLLNSFANVKWFWAGT